MGATTSAWRHRKALLGNAGFHDGDDSFEYSFSCHTVTKSSRQAVACSFLGSELQSFQCEGRGRRRPRISATSFLMALPYSDVPSGAVERGSGGAGGHGRGGEAEGGEPYDSNGSKCHQTCDPPPGRVCVPCGPQLPPPKGPFVPAGEVQGVPYGPGGVGYAPNRTRAHDERNYHSEVAGNNMKPQEGACNGHYHLDGTDLRSELVCIPR